MKSVKWFLAVLLVLMTGCMSEGEVRVGEGGGAAAPAQLSAGPTPRIIGGSNFDGLEAVGALVYDGGQHCTGTLIEPNKVLTAAHCLEGFHATRMQFVTGASLSQAVTITDVRSLHPHPSYDGYALVNDIGYVILEEAPGVSPMPVLEDMDSAWVGESLFFVGYGNSNGYAGTGAGVKRAVWMDISQVSSTTFRYDDSGKNTCNGDSGGPAFARDSQGNFLVAGVTSYGDQYCVDYGVDTRVDTYLDFLELTQAAAIEDGCQGETWEGRCDGEVLYWCQDNQARSYDCTKSDKVCGTDPSGFNCIEPEEVDPCAGETFEGRCADNKVIWCEDEKIQSQQCDSDEVCTYDSENGYFACREAVVADPCQGETFEGRCSGDMVIWCENETVKSVDCGDRNLTCGYASGSGYYACLQY